MITPQPTISIHTLDMEPTKSEPICIKMEDLECLPSAAPAVPSLSTVPLSPTTFSPTSDGTPSSTPAPSTQSQTPEPKAAKKRKSWGQVLPEPKTNLPPRKRAKTEDEKEQRRIERVRRNRLAAHNSRERKRVEVENLLGEKNQLELVVRRLEETVRQQALYIERLTSAMGVGQGMPSGVTAADMAALTAGISFNAAASSPSSDAPSTPMSRAASSGFVGTPTLSAISSPDSAALPLTPETKPVGESELTQHSAAMLCSPDLQCHSDSPTSSLSSSAWRLAISTLLMILSTFPILAPAISLSSRPTARTARRRNSRQRRSSPTFLPAFLNSPWTTTTSSPTSPRTSKSTLATPSLLCSQAQAQLFQLATGQALLRRATASLFERQCGRLVSAERMSLGLDPDYSLSSWDGQRRERTRRRRNLRSGRLAGRERALRGARVARQEIDRGRLPAVLC
jgi:transcriptional activator HAC1